MLIVQRERELIFNPQLTQAVKKGDVLVIAGSDEEIDKWLKQMKSTEEAEEGED